MTPRIRLPITLMLPLLAVFLLGVRTLSSPDIWMHMASGRHILSHGTGGPDPFSYVTPQDTRWINPSWLYDVLVFGLWRLGSVPLIVLFHATCAALALCGLAVTARRYAPDAAVGLAILAAGWLWAPQLVPGPFPVATLLFGSLTLTLFPVAALSNRRWAVALVLQILWTNMSGTFFLGPLLAALSALEARKETAQAGGRDPLTERIALTAVLLLACLVNPYGLHLPALVLRSFVDGSLGGIHEWISPFAAQFRFTAWKNFVTLVLALVAAGFIFVRARLPLAFTTLGVLGAFLLVRSHTQSDLSAILTFVFLSISLSAMGIAIAGFFPALRRSATVLLLFATVATCLLALTGGYLRASGSASAFGCRVQEDAYPVAAVETLAALPPEIRIAQLPRDGGYLAWARPDSKIFCDQRSFLYGPSFFDLFQRMLRGDVEASKELQLKWDPQVLLLPCAWPGAPDAIRALLSGGAWGLAYFDGTSALLVRGTAQNAPLIGRKDIQDAGLARLEAGRRSYASSLSGWPAPANSTRLIGAGPILQSLGRFREAEAIFTLLVRGTPRLTTAWRDLCNSRLAQGRLDEALAVMNARDNRLTLASRVWLWVNLHRIYQSQGATEKAQDALMRARELDSAFADFLTSTNTKGEPPRAP